MCSRRPRMNNLMRGSPSQGDIKAWAPLKVAIAASSIGTVAAGILGIFAWAVSILVQPSAPALSWYLGAFLISLLPLAFSIAGWLLLLRRATHWPLLANIFPLSLLAIVILAAAFRGF